MNDEHIDPEEFARLTSDSRRVPAEIQEEDPRGQPASPAGGELIVDRQQS